MISGSVQYGDGSNNKALGCEPFVNGSLVGKIVLVHRGGCTFTQKVSNIGVTGGKVGINGLIADGEPFSGGFDDI
jgi:hypothetical protein